MRGSAGFGLKYTVNPLGSTCCSAANAGKGEALVPVVKVEDIEGQRTGNNWVVAATKFQGASHS